MTFSSLRLLGTILLVCLVARGDNEERIDQILGKLESMRRFGGVQISPDGASLIWVEDEADGKTAVYLKHGKAKPLRLTAGKADQFFNEGDTAWSHDSKQIAFVSNANGSQQLYLVNSSEPGRPKKVTGLQGHLARPTWSADDKHIAFLYTEGGGAGDPLAAVPEQTGVIGAGFVNQRLMVLDLPGATPRAVTPTDINIYEYSWSPKGDSFAAIAAPGPADNNWWVAKLYTVDIAGKISMLYRPPANQQIASPCWSPDGSRIAFLGGLMSDEGFLGGDIFAISAAGGSAQNLTPDIHYSPNGLRWRTDKEIIFTAAIEGGGAIGKLDPANRSAELIWKGEPALHEDGNYRNFSLAEDGNASAAVISTWQQAPEIWSGAIGNWHRVTNANAKFKPEWGKAESLTWSSDGFRVQGWLLYPLNYNPANHYPMVVSIHGGPAGQRSPAWPSVHFDMSAMASLGYFVFFPNPRGSYGEGEAFTQANVKDFGYGDLRDVLAGVDTVLRNVPVDSARIGVTGWSYGGYMTMWAVTQTNRFRAAVAGAGIADWLSYYGENSIDEWMIPYFGASVYDDPQVYAKSSPITYIKQVKTPTLVVVGERDGECPAPQSFEFWHALRTEGVPTELVVYQGEGHSFRDQKDRVDVMRRTLGWFDKFLGK